MSGRLNAICTGQSIERIPTDFDLDIKVLKISEDRLIKLSSTSLDRYVQLQEIYITACHLKYIAAAAFHPVENLHILDLSKNRLERIPSEAIKMLYKLRELILRVNPIRTLERSDLSGLLRLTKIDLCHCRLRNIHPKAFEDLNKLLEINIAGNELQTISSDTFFPPSLSVLRIFKNPWNCDCHLRWLLKYCQSKRGTISWKFGRRIPACSEPELLEGVGWTSLNTSSFACAPTILSHSETRLTTRKGSNSSLYCLSSGDPQPEVAWFYKGSRILLPEESRKKIVLSRTNDDHIFDYNSTLVFYKISNEDTGSYKCQARNSAGQSEVTFIVTFTDSSKFSSNQANISRLRLISVSLTCLLIVIIAFLVGLVVVRYVKRRKRRCVYRIDHDPLKGDQESMTAPLKNINEEVHSTPDLLRGSCSNDDTLDGATGILNKIELYGTAV
ncbi:DgyrCDS10050 [Dimorphilus gyrociliatus]|uniref:DgyrCDS10050 n=1 Tax=Dimorphilus gyrociliatus TaxID=2664684 RepID=A0A7I8W460_9ANNE|nr:DgyrCDS10050 [Dimorphilus gyrociliatus]